MNEQVQAPRVQWNPRDRNWFFKFRIQKPGQSSFRTSKNVPVSIAHLETEDHRVLAQAYADQYLTDVKANGGEKPKHEVKPQPPAKATIRSLHEKWFEHRDGHLNTKYKTFQGMKTSMTKYFLQDVIADLPIVDTTPHDCRAFVDRIVAMGKSAYYSRNIVSDLETFYDDVIAKRWAPVMVNPIAAAKFVKEGLPAAQKRIGKKDTIHMGAVKAKALIQCENPVIPPIRRVRNLFAITQGAREGEIAGTAWNFLHLHPESPCPFHGWEGHEDSCESNQDIPHVHIDRQLEETGEFSGCKKESERCLPLHPVTLEALRWLERDGWARVVGRQPGPDDPVFPVNEEALYGRPKSAAFLRSDLRAAGLPDTYKGYNFDVQALRRSFSTIMGDAGVDVETRGILLGHESSRVTHKHYTARNVEQYVNAINAIDIGPPIVLDPTQPRVGLEIPTPEVVIPPKTREEHTLTKGRADQGRSKTPRNTRGHSKKSETQKSASEARRVQTRDIPTPADQPQPLPPTPPTQVQPRPIEALMRTLDRTNAMHRVKVIRAANMNDLAEATLVKRWLNGGQDWSRARSR